MSDANLEKRQVSILMIEDNPADAFLSREILSESERADYAVTTMKDGVEALAYLHKDGGRQNASKPDIILLDLNLPRMNGFEFLSRIKADPELNSIRVCILTTSGANEDIEKARNLKAECYLVKPLNLKAFEEAFSGIDMS